MRKARKIAGKASDESQERRRGHPQGTKRGKYHFATLMDLCHFKNSGLEHMFRTYEGRGVLRGDDAYAVFTEQGSSASQMTAANVMDVISRLTGRAGQASDAVSASTHVKMEDTPTLTNFLGSGCPDIWIRLPRYKLQRGWRNTVIRNTVLTSKEVITNSPNKSFHKSVSLGLHWNQDLTCRPFPQ